MSNVIIYNNTVSFYNQSLNNNTNPSSTSTDQTNILSIIHYGLISVVALHLIYLIYFLIKNNLCRSTNQQDPQENLRKINDECSICLENILYEVQLLCSHSFCASCIVDYGKQRWGFVNIQCPICRSESKLMIVQFEKNEENKKLYDMIISYNYEVTAAYKTSFCLCFDILKFSFYYFRQITNLSNPRYRGHRFIILCLIISILLYVLYPEKYINDHYEIIEDIICYVFLIILCSENFYRRFRNETNSEFLLHDVDSLSRRIDDIDRDNSQVQNNINEEGNVDDVNNHVEVNRLNNVPDNINNV